MIASGSMIAIAGETAGAMHDLKEMDVFAALLILVLGIVLGVGVACLLMVVHFLRKGRVAGRSMPRRLDLASRERQPHSPIFHIPSRWLAVRSGNPQWVQAALGLDNPTPCSWEEGLHVAHDRKLFISPAIRGWVLVMGSSLPEPADDVDRCFRFILEVSRKLGHVQFFSVNRAVNHHAWVHADQGVIQRAYAWAGKAVWNQGALTRAEIELGLKCYGYGEGEDRIDYGRPDPAALNTERLPLLASRWSLDPTSVDARMLKENRGIAGQLSRTGAS